MTSPMIEWMKKPEAKKILQRVHRLFLAKLEKQGNAAAETKVTPSKVDPQTVLRSSSEEEERYLFLLILITCQCRELEETGVTSTETLGQLKALQKGISQVLKSNDKDCQIYKEENRKDIVKLFTNRKDPWLKEKLNTDIKDNDVTIAFNMVASCNVDEDTSKNLNDQVPHKVKGFDLLQHILNNIVRFNCPK